VTAKSLYKKCSALLQVIYENEELKGEQSGLTLLPLQAGPVRMRLTRHTRCIFQRIKLDIFCPHRPPNINNDVKAWQLIMHSHKNEKNAINFIERNN